MPAMIDDPASPTIYRVSGAPPFPDPEHPAVPSSITPRLVTLRDRQTVATILPIASRDQLPASLTEYLCDQFNKEIDGGDTYPMMDRFTSDSFARYWYQNFAAVMLLGELGGADQVEEGKDWSKECLGSFYIKPNYPGRSSHVCNAGFLVTDASRNRGVGRLMGEAYITWAPHLGYTYSVFNLVYETNVASCRIWDALGFKRIGRVKDCGNLKSYPGRLVDAIIYGRDLAPGEGEELVSEERFDKIKYYLKSGKYPNGADRAEKSRLRSAATHYKLTDDDKLMLKDKEVISDPGQQYEIARTMHVTQHVGINRTTAMIAEKYHWSRIKETVSDVIRNCPECKETGKSNIGPGAVKGSALHGATSSPYETPAGREPSGLSDQTGSSGKGGGHDHGMSDGAFGFINTLSEARREPPISHDYYADPKDFPSLAGEPGSEPDQTLAHNPMLQDQPMHHLAPYSSTQPIDPQIIHSDGKDGDGEEASRAGSENRHMQHAFESYHSHFQALLSATDDDSMAIEEEEEGWKGDREGGQAVAAAAGQSSYHTSMDRDLDMLIVQNEEEDDDMRGGGGALGAMRVNDDEEDQDEGGAKVEKVDGERRHNQDNMYSKRER